MRRCLEIAGRLCSKSAASALTARPPAPRRSRIARRVGSAMAPKTSAWARARCMILANRSVTEKRATGKRSTAKWRLLLVGEQPALALDAAAVADQLAVGANHPVAGDHDADRVRAIGQADRAHRRWAADRARDVTVGSAFSARDPAQRAPDRALERGAGGFG